MFKRVRWMAAGAAVGLGASLWTQRKVKAVAARYRPSGLAGTAIEKARTWPGEVRAALDEGRTTMRQREAELRREPATGLAVVIAPTGPGRRLVEGRSPVTGH